MMVTASKQPCTYHPKRGSTHLRTVVDLENSGHHASDIVYKKIPICWECAHLYRPVNTERIEPIEGTEQ